MLLGAPGLTRSKKLLGAPGIATRSDRTLLKAISGLFTGHPRS